MQLRATDSTRLDPPSSPTHAWWWSPGCSGGEVGGGGGRWRWELEVELEVVVEVVVAVVVEVEVVPWAEEAAEAPRPWGSAHHPWGVAPGLASGTRRHP